MLGPVSWSVPVATADGMVNRLGPSLYTTSNEDGTRPSNGIRLFIKRSYLDALCPTLCYMYYIGFLFNFMHLSAQLYGIQM